jgi:hypothetical protein
MEERGYFAKDEARVPGAETVLEPRDDEAVVFEDFFVARLCMPPHPALADILLHFQAQLHQLMPNAIVQLPKFFWVVGSFGGVPSGSVFEKRYELHCCNSGGGACDIVWMPKLSCEEGWWSEA